MLNAAIRNIMALYSGPGGAVAVLREGEVLERHAWGWADAERRTPFKAATPFRMCSITKQFTCALVLDLFSDVTEIDKEIRATMPLLAQVPSALELCHNQSGLRDYFAVAMACGAAVEGSFNDADAQALIARVRTTQFTPGTRYSYANQNFRILSDIVERRCGRPFGELLRKRIFDKAGMADAFIATDTESLAGGTTGYEGTPETGFRAAVNRIRWTGDAALAATLDDMIAWERLIDATRDDERGLYTRLTAPVTFRDGNLAAYGYGLSRASLLGYPATSHGGGLRGWRSFRAYIPSTRVSVVVMFNHMADARAAALELLGAVFPSIEPERPSSADVPAGRYLEPETGLATRIEHEFGGTRLFYNSHPELLSGGSTVTLRTEAGGVRMDRPSENQSTLLQLVDGTPDADIDGRFHCAELDADLTCMVAGGVASAAFSGFLGQGTMLALRPLARDLWLLPCPRALDFSPPGDWTLRFRRDASGKIEGAEVGCWLARRLDYRR